MPSSFHQIISTELKIKPEQVMAVADLFADGATIPFIARYRKEATGLLDEVVISQIQTRLEQLANQEKRRQTITTTLTDLKLLSPELEKKLAAAASLVELEDLYLPYRPKRKTRALQARERGLLPLAELLFSQPETNPETAARAFINPEKGITSLTEALAGARDIIAEKINEDLDTRTVLRRLFTRESEITALVIKGKEEEGGNFRDYFDWREKSTKIAGHRLLALFRGEKAGILRLSLRPPTDKALALIRQQFIRQNNLCAQEVELALNDAYKRLLAPALENESRQVLREAAEGEAIAVFADNLRQLLLAPPLGEKRVMALDPGFRSGAKLVCLDASGQLLEHTVIYPATSSRQSEAAAEIVTKLCRRHKIEAIAIGNGTAGRETESFIRSLDLPENIIISMVNEAGASIYSASEIARQEFPDLDLTVRGAISIGRRLQDPLSELVKIEAKAIGVGQYQHDLEQTRLQRRLDEVVSSCVNRVGVEVNSASAELLTYVAGLNATIARNIVSYRNENGPFHSRRELLKVPRLGPKAFEQAAGFLRMQNADNPLDASAVHPENYLLVKQMAEDYGLSLKQLMQNEKLRQEIVIENYLSAKVGRPTLDDIMAELARPGRDPRREFTQFCFQKGINKIEDLAAGMRLPGLVTNITKFGAFVDIGVHQDGLVHISQMADRFVRDPGEVVKLGQAVSVTVLNIDQERRRIALSLRTTT
ncbi:MAG: RNA-binding transcriptional accessory protein [Deltaproteobacteria bacterium]|nr:RNA-binding transcriptional accessory protein [Deltaproteobacteria bacterium]